MTTDILIVGSGCAGLYCAMNLPSDKQILLITKADTESSDSFLARGGMCMLTGEDDYETYFEDTLKAGHYKNDKKSVEIMIRSSRDVVNDLLSIGTDFERDENGNLAFTREGAHRSKRILYHEDITGKEITSKLLQKVKTLSNVTILEYTTLVDIIEDGRCKGGIIRKKNGETEAVYADYTILATGGIGGIYEHSTNFRRLTGDGVAICAMHGVELKDMSYIQIHPTTFYSPNRQNRSFLISESVRGEGAKLYDKSGNRFTNELLPRDLLTEKIYERMQKDGTKHVWEDLRTIEPEELENHFPNIVAHCKTRGYDPTKECIPVVPARHYFMGGIKIDYSGKTSMERLFAIGETACNGVHGANRLASNSLLEALVFAKKAAKCIEENYSKCSPCKNEISFEKYADYDAYRIKLKTILNEEIQKDKTIKKENENV